MDTLKHHLRLVRPAEGSALARLEETLGEREMTTFLASEYPLLATGIPGDLHPKDFAGSNGLAPHAEARLRECAACPTRGGLCSERATTDSMFRPGMRPYWDQNIRQIGEAQCDKWDTYLLYRQLLVTGIRERQAMMRFSNYHPKTRSQKGALKAAEEYAAAFDARTTSTGLLFSSKTPGVGKTHLAIAVVAELLRSRRIRRAQFEFVPDFLDKIRRAMDSSEEYGFIIDRAKRAPLLVLDDLGAQKTTEWVREQLLIITNERWGSGLPTIVTQNDNADDCRATLGERAYSRLMSDMTGIVLVGADGRREVP